jgi:1-acyl-sn-glycerol-3-phosphate acyltransferase
VTDEFRDKVEGLKKELEEKERRKKGNQPLSYKKERSIHTLTSFKSLLSKLKEDEKIVIFPEGTHFPSVMGPGKTAR